MSSNLETVTAINSFDAVQTTRTSGAGDGTVTLDPRCVGGWGFVPLYFLSDAMAAPKRLWHKAFLTCIMTGRAGGKTAAWIHNPGGAARRVLEKALSNI